ncbi:Mor transcription activator family protein [Mobilisporobacter senegalensis]|uniref:Mor transcription activator family protein n=1 Tax=Mobilisporobacter senegalensis TaxID=1329262 RepID=A0A3N1XP91_9FIRM|nr:Mor transcription activator family protein [Mobilisporobacter senegalensis]ROR28499.1 Mor transcription activator family protein [Mobilisporobacter senegalensis]
MEDDQSKKLEDYAGIYRDIAEFAGPDIVYLIYKNLRGQQVTFPKKLYTTECIIRQVIEEYNGTNLKQLATKYEYTERHLRKMIKEFSERGEKKVNIFKTGKKV